jgi:hypothetical protein
MSILAPIRALVMGEFTAFCEKSPDAFDLEMLAALIAQYTGSPEVKGTSTKKPRKSLKVDEESCGICRMPVPDTSRCMARTFSTGFGYQCTSKTSDEYCKTHSKQMDSSESGVLPLGRIDEPRRKCVMRGDCKTSAKWKNFIEGDDGVEDISKEAVGVGSCAQEPAAPVSAVPESDAQESDQESDTQESNKESSQEPPVPESVVPEPASPESDAQESNQESDAQESNQVSSHEPAGPESAVQEPASPVSDAQESSQEPAVQGSVQEPDQEPASDEEDPDVDPNIDAPGPTITPEESSPKLAEAEDPVQGVEKLASPADSDSDTEEDDIDEDMSTSKKGTYQGVLYTFVGTPGDMIIQSIPNPKKKSAKAIEAGTFDGETVIIHESYEYIHDAHPACDEELGDEVIWE